MFGFLRKLIGGRGRASSGEQGLQAEQAEEKLRLGEERFRLLVEAVQEYAIFQLDPLGHVVSWNAGSERLKGYSTDEIIGKHFSVFYSPEDVVNGKPEQALAEATQRGQNVDEGWRIRKDGSRFWANVVLTALRDTKGRLHGFAKLTRDMSERHEKEEALTKAKELLELRFEQRTTVLARVNNELRVEIADRERAEQQLKASLDKLRALAARLQKVREEERTSIAREIHDELGQACTAIKMDLALISRKTTKRQEQLRSKIESTVHLVDDMIVTLRRIASELRPRTLDDLGLTAALEWHAQATRVEARLQKDVDELVFQVHDNGRGFDPDEAKARKSLGLVGMQERALLLNGELKIAGAPGAGTTMTLRIPLSTQAARKRKQD